MIALGCIALGAVLLMLLSAMPKVRMEHCSLFAFVTLLIGLILTLTSFGELFTFFPLPKFFHKMLIVDSYSVYFDAIILSGALVTSLIGTHYFQAKRHFKKEFFSLFLFSVFGMMLLVHASELLSAFIALEIASLSLYVMIGFQKVHDKRVEASFQYLVLGSLAGIFFLLGSEFAYRDWETRKAKKTLF